MAAFSIADLPDMSGKTVIVTGANSGIGRAAAAAFANAGARVVLAVRDLAKGQAAASAIGAVVATADEPPTGGPPEDARSTSPGWTPSARSRAPGRVR